MMRTIFGWAARATRFECMTSIKRAKAAKQDGKWFLMVKSLVKMDAAKIPLR